MSLSEVKAKDRHSAQEGDITGFYGNRREKFKLFVALDHRRAKELFVKSTNIIYFDDLNDFEYEVYCINLNKTPANYKKTKDKFLEILERNFRFVHGLRKAQIVKMEGEKILGIPIYHHHAIFSDKDKFKIIHKWGEPDSIEVAMNVVSGQGLKNVEIREDNILEVACCRLLSLEDSYEAKYEDIRDADEIINDARKQIGSTNYNLFNDNCQHFCTSKRYGESKSIEVEKAKTAVVGATIGLGIGLGISLIGLIALSSKKKNKDKETDYY